MKMWTVLFCAVLSLSVFAEDGATPARRTKEYNWMSVARWNEMHESFVKRGKEGPIEVLFLGDSITEGWGGAGRPVWEKNYAPLKAANFGIGGDMTNQVLWRITEGKELEGLNPKVCVLMIGTNNFGLGGQNVDSVVKGVKAVVDTLHAKLPKTKILLLGIFPRDSKPDTPMRKNIAAVNAQIAKADNGNTVRYLDIGPTLQQPDGSLSKEIMPDYLHLSTKGYEIWAAAIEATLKEMLK